MANIITCSRVLFSLILLFTKAFSTSFYALYIMAGITDVLDGIVARKFKLESEFGEKLDTVADIFVCNYATDFNWRVVRWWCAD